MHNDTVTDLNDHAADEAGDDGFDDAGVQSLPAGTTLLFGQYTLTGYINCGGFGITYLAEDSLGRDVAVKECFPGELCYRSGIEVLPRGPSLKGELDFVIRHFIKEAQSLAALKHDNIVHVHQIFEENATAYMVMDYIDGPDVLDIVDGEGMRLAPKAVETLTRAMLRALAYVHDTGLLHRDISPDNILIAKSGLPILIDFGSARQIAEAPSARPSRLKFVKDGYSPQEFYIKSQEQGPWSDFYSLGATLYHLVAGAPPEDGRRRLAALAASEPDKYEPLAGRFEEYSPGYLDSIDKALEVLPKNRIQSADDWLYMLGADRPPTERREATSVAQLVEQPGALAEVFAASVLARLDGKRRHLMAGSAAAGLLLAGGVAVSVLGGAGETDIASVSPGALLDTSEIADIAPLDEVSSAPSAVEGPPEISNVERVALLPATDPIALVDPLPVDHQPETATITAGLVAPVSALAGDALSPFSPLPEVALALPLAEIDGPVASAPVVARQSPVQVEVPPPLVDAGTVDAGANDAPIIKLAEVAALPDSPGVEASLVRPSLPVSPDVVLASGVAVSFQPGLTELAGVTAAGFAALPKLTGVAPLPTVWDDVMLQGDLTPPSSLALSGAILEFQVASSHWDVVMPFESEPVRVRNSNTVTITDVAEGADLGVSGDWIGDGVVIYSLNGEKLLPDTAFSAHVLQGLAIDPDGYTRATVLYRASGRDNIQRGLLAVPVVREIGLADGTRIEARIEGQAWVMTVTEAGADSALRPGDRISGEVQTGLTFTDHEGLAQALNVLASSGVGIADLTVLRNGKTQQIAWALVRTD